MLTAVILKHINHNYFTLRKTVKKQFCCTHNDNTIGTRLIKNTFFKLKNLYLGVYLLVHANKIGR